MYIVCSISVTLRRDSLREVDRERERTRGSQSFCLNVHISKTYERFSLMCIGFVSDFDMCKPQCLEHCLNLCESNSTSVHLSKPG